MTEQHPIYYFALWATEQYGKKHILVKDDGGKNLNAVCSMGKLKVLMLPKQTEGKWVTRLDDEPESFKHHLETFQHMADSLGASDVAKQLLSEVSDDIH